LRDAELKPIHVAVALEEFKNTKMNLVRYEDKSTKTQISVGPLLKGIKNLNMMSDQGNVNID
jgi:hypothetical protein